MKKIAVLLPGFSGMFNAAHVLMKKAKKATGSNCLITVNIEKVKDLLKTKKLSRVVVVMGSKHCKNAITKDGMLDSWFTYKELRKTDGHVEIVVVDGFPFNVPKLMQIGAKADAFTVFKRALSPKIQKVWLFPKNV